ncbi:MAG: SH3 domain-containing protein [Spirochaetes bacterium]|nr:SH3 domain-containing protein [Spirochaetota bacterium]
MKKIIPAMILFLIHFTVYANAGTKMQVYTMGAFEEGALVFLAADTVNIRSVPAIGNNIIDNLPVGYQVKVEKRSDATYTVDGLKASWYQVSYNGAKGFLRGFVWGGFLSVASLPVQYKGNPAIILFAIKSAKNTGTIPVLAMIAGGGKIISKTSLEAIGILDGDRAFSYTIAAELHGNRGFAGVSNVITLDFNYPACGFPFGTIVLVYNGSEIICGPHSLNMVEGGVFHSFENFIFPDEKKGIKNGLVKIMTHEEFDDAKKKYILKETKQSSCAWTGTRFTEMK